MHVIVEMKRWKRIFLLPDGMFGRHFGGSPGEGNLRILFLPSVHNYDLYQSSGE